MRFRLRGTVFHIHPLTIIAAIMACVFGLSEDLAATMAALSVHELAHLMAARMLNVAITRIDLMPFGGAAQMQNPYSLGSFRLAGVALAGPAGNLAFATVSAALGWAGWLSLHRASLLVQSNLILMLFNLLPALPLDGGRILYAALTPLCGEKRALSAGIWAGRLLAIIIVICALTGFLYSRKLNLTMLLAAVFIMAASFNEYRSQQEGRAAALSGAFHQERSPHKLTLIALDPDSTLLDAARMLRAGDERLFVICGGRHVQFIPQAELLKALAENNGEAQLSAPVSVFADGKKSSLSSGTIHP